MIFRSINPADGTTLRTIAGLSELEVDRALATAAAATWPANLWAPCLR